MRALFLLFALSILGSLEAIEQKPWNPRILNDYCKQVRCSKGWTVLGQGRGAPKDKEIVVIMFKSGWRLSLGEARRVFVLETQKLIDRYNSRPNPCNGSFNIDNLGYSISFQDSSFQYYGEPYMASVACARGIVFYDRINPATGRLDTIFEEPYEEAVRIVREECHCSDSR